MDKRTAEERGLHKDALVTVIKMSGKILHPEVPRTMRIGDVFRVEDVGTDVIGLLITSRIPIPGRLLVVPADMFEPDGLELMYQKGVNVKVVRNRVGAYRPDSHENAFDEDGFHRGLEPGDTVEVASQERRDSGLHDGELLLHYNLGPGDSNWIPALDVELATLTVATLGDCTCPAYQLLTYVGCTCGYAESRKRQTHSPIC